MANKKQASFSAKSLRSTLLLTLTIMMAAGGAGMYYAQQYITEFATEVSETVATADASNQNRETLQQLQAQLDARSLAITLLDSFYASTSNVKNKVIEDLNRYANKAGVVVTDFQFDANDGTTNISGASQSVTISLSSPVPYDSFIQFLSLIETNLPKMQVSTAQLTRNNEDPAGSVAVDTMVIEVYTQ